MKKIIILLLISLPVNANISLFKNETVNSITIFENLSYCSGVLNGTDVMLNFMIEPIEQDLINEYPYLFYKSIFDYQNDISNYAKLTNSKLKLFVTTSCNVFCKEKMKNSFSKGWDYAIDYMMLMYDEDFVYNIAGKDSFIEADKIIENCSSQSKQFINTIKWEDI